MLKQTSGHDWSAMLLEEIAVQRTLNWYTEGVSRTDWDQVMATFAPDAIWEVAGAGLRAAGHDDILVMLKKMTAQFSSVMQINAPAAITIDGDEAVARSPIREGGRQAGADQAMDFFGNYHDRLIRTPEGWKFAHRTFHTVQVHRFPLHPEA